MERCQCEFLCPVPDPVYHGLSSVVWVGVVYQRSERGLPSYGVSEPPGETEGTTWTLFSRAISRLRDVTI